LNSCLLAQSLGQKIVNLDIGSPSNKLLAYKTESHLNFIP